jgi:hypothetical protein
MTYAFDGTVGANVMGRHYVPQNYPKIVLKIF